MLTPSAPHPKFSILSNVCILSGNSISLLFESLCIFMGLISGLPAISVNHPHLSSLQPPKLPNTIRPLALHNVLNKCCTDFVFNFSSEEVPFHSYFPIHAKAQGASPNRWRSPVKINYTRCPVPQLINYPWDGDDVVKRRNGGRNVCV